MLGETVLVQQKRLPLKTAASPGRAAGTQSWLLCSQSIIPANVPARGANNGSTTIHVGDPDGIVGTGFCLAQPGEEKYNLSSSTAHLSQPPCHSAF